MCILHDILFGTIVCWECTLTAAAETGVSIFAIGSIWAPRQYIMNVIDAPPIRAKYCNVAMSALETCQGDWNNIPYDIMPTMRRE